jgi:hypothetical protein
MWTLGRYAVSIGASALLAGCGGSQPPIGAPGATLQSRAIATHTALGASWMAPEAKSEDLLYVTEGDKVPIYSYPHGKLEKEIHSYYGNTFEGECADGRGNVYVIDDNDLTSGNTYIEEYAHGRARGPIRRLFDHLNFDQMCAVDPTSGDLAVTEGGSVKIWHPHAKYGKRRRLPNYFANYACSYDDNGNLFVNGAKPGNPRDFFLAELPKGSRTFVAIALPGMQTTKLGPGGIRWDGEYLAFSNRANKIYRLTVSGTQARIAGTVNLEEATRVSSIWIHGNTVVGGGYIWDYPAGGKPIGSVAAGDSAGVAVSVPPH